MRRITITAGAVTATAILNDSRTADAIWNALPLEARARTWGDEIYFDVPVDCPPEAPREVVDRGDLGCWPPGRAFRSERPPAGGTRQDVGRRDLFRRSGRLPAGGSA